MRVNKPKSILHRGAAQCPRTSCMSGLHFVKEREEKKKKVSENNKYTTVCTTVSDFSLREKKRMRNSHIIRFPIHRTTLNSTEDLHYCLSPVISPFE